MRVVVICIHCFDTIVYRGLQKYSRVDSSTDFIWCCLFLMVAYPGSPAAKENQEWKTRSRSLRSVTSKETSHVILLYSAAPVALRRCGGISQKRTWGRVTEARPHKQRQRPLFGFMYFVHEIWSESDVKQNRYSLSLESFPLMMQVATQPGILIPHHLPVLPLLPSPSVCPSQRQNNYRA